jgi:hypothetical protein
MMTKTGVWNTIFVSPDCFFTVHGNHDLSVIHDRLGPVLYLM